jgi:hypothetical protein
MRPLVRKWLALVAASVGLYLVLPDQGLAQSITVGTLKGTYVSAQSGYLTDPSGNLIAFTVAGHETFFGDGNASGVVSFAVKGQPFQHRITFTATYTVNADGSVSETSTTSTGSVLHYDLYPTLDGSTIASIQTDPGAFFTGTFTRSSGKALLNP